jgi:predicted Ser/Thr protein kinase
MAQPDHGGELLSSGYQGVVYKIRSDSSFFAGSEFDGRLPENQFLILKEVMGPPLISKLRRWMIRREYEAYRRLEGVSGTPRCFGLLNGDRLLLEFIEGQPLRLSSNELVDRDEFFSALLEVILVTHRAGVAHSDLKRKENILVASNRKPYLIDFGSAVVRKNNDGFWNRWVFNLACQIDLNAWVKHKYLGRYDEISADDAKYFSPTLVERSARIVRRFWRRVTGRRWRKARKQSHR